MRAAVYRGDRQVVVEEIPVPALGPRDVLVEVAHCGICGSDLHFVLDGWSPPGRVHGHEWTGRVHAVGRDVTRWRPGDLVVGGPGPACGTCAACRSGRPNLCAGREAVGERDPGPGAFAEYHRTSEDALLALPDGVDLRAGALAEPLAVALHGVRRGGVRAGQRVLVTGAGPIGALSIAVLVHGGVTDVTCSEPAPARRDLAARLGARVLHPDELVVPVSPNALVDVPFDVALECSGRGPAMVQALGQLARGGTLVLVGAGMDRPRFDANRILLNELVVTGAFTYDPDGFDQALRLLADPGFPVAELIEDDDVPLERVGEAIAGLGAGRIAGKVLVTPGR
jgi:(R,R)-butanediol dehydrogenase/meso-butanediol dehydrogenase/diacetyl reductase